MNEPSYKPSLGKLFCDAADIRFRMSHLSTNKEVSNILNQKRTAVREVVVEKDLSRSDNKKLTNCNIQITTKGLEAFEK